MSTTTKLSGCKAKRCMKRTLGVALLCALALASQLASVQAQSKPKREPKVIQLEEIKIEGRVQKPNAFYILNRSNIGYEVMDLRTSFLRDIVRSLQSQTF